MRDAFSLFLGVLVARGKTCLVMDVAILASDDFLNFNIHPQIPGYFAPSAQSDSNIAS